VLGWLPISFEDPAQILLVMELLVLGGGQQRTGRQVGVPPAAGPWEGVQRTLRGGRGTSLPPQHEKHQKKAGNGKEKWSEQTSGREGLFLGMDPWLHGMECLWAGRVQGSGGGSGHARNGGWGGESLESGDGIGTERRRKMKD
jgi:hypothetical protein